MIESGTKFNNSLFEQNLIDEIALFRSDKLIEMMAFLFWVI